CRYDRSGNDRREEYTDLPDRNPHEQGDHSADDLGPEDGTDIITFGNGLHTRNIGKTDSHDDRQGGAKLKFLGAYKRKELQQCGKSRGKESCLDQNDSVCVVETRYTRYDDSRRYTSYDHSHNMLKRQRKRLPELRHTIQFKYRRT